jgi:hypothetical protein
MDNEAVNVEAQVELGAEIQEQATETQEQVELDTTIPKVDYDLANPAVVARISERVTSRFLNQNVNPVQNQQVVQEEPMYEEADRPLTIREFQSALQQQQYQQQAIMIQQEATTHDAIINDYFQHAVSNVAKDLSEEQRAYVQMQFLDTLNKVPQKSRLAAEAAVNEHKTFLASYLAKVTPAKSKMSQAMPTAQTPARMDDLAIRAERGELTMAEALKIINGQKS